MAVSIRFVSGAAAGYLLCVSAAQAGPAWDFPFLATSFSQANSAAPGIDVALHIGAPNATSGTFSPPQGGQQGNFSKDIGNGTAQAYSDFTQFQTASDTAGQNAWSLHATAPAGTSNYTFTADLSGISPDSIPKVTISSPVDGTTLPAQPTFQWTQSGQALLDVLQVSNADFTVNETFNLPADRTSFTLPTALPPGTYSLFLNASTGAIPIPIHPTLVNGPDLKITPNGTFQFAAQAIGTFAIAPNQEWNIDADGNWATNSNWIQAAPTTAGERANFSNVITAPRTVTLNNPETIGHLLFNSDFQYTLAGPQPLTISNGADPADITLFRGSHVISAPLVLASDTTLNVAIDQTLNLTGNFSIQSGKTLTFNGSGFLTITGPQSHGSGSSFVADSGGTNFNSDPGFNLSITANAITNFGGGAGPGISPMHTNLNIGSTGRVILTPSASSSSRTVLVASALNFAGVSGAWQGQLDLNNNDLIVKNADPAAVKDQLKEGFNGGTWTGIGGIMSSAAANSTSPKMSLGYTSKTGTFDGESVTTSDTLIKYTLVGDTDLNGSVNFTDLLAVAQHYGLTSTTWSTGDFNYDGTTNFNDLLTLAQNYNQSLSALTASQLSQLDVAGGNSFAGALAQAEAIAVPEPSAGAMVLIGVGTSICRRRRKCHA